MSDQFGCLALALDQNKRLFGSWLVGFDIKGAVGKVRTNGAAAGVSRMAERDKMGKST
jgi:hypothetical protein